MKIHHDSLNLDTNISFFQVWLDLAEKSGFSVFHAYQAGVINGRSFFLEGIVICALSTDYMSASVWFVEKRVK